jgi:hypothetical protein
MVLGGGGTGFVRMLPVVELPQLLRSRLTCEGGGATTAGAGNDNLEEVDTSRGGAETGGATTSAVAVSGERELARSRCASLGGGAITDGFIESPLRILLRVTSGAGATTGVLKAGVVRVLVWDTSGAGGTTLAVRSSCLRLTAEFSSGVGGTTAALGSAGATSLDRKPSAGGGPGRGLKASRFATAESECGKFSLGASTTFSLGRSPRATRMVCVR